MAKLRLRLYRFDPRHDSAPRYEEYEIVSDGPLSVMQAICRVYETVDGTLSLRNTDCRRGVCGICSMMINGRRRLACASVAEDGMTIAPPPNRKVIKDLVFEMD